MGSKDKDSKKAVKSLKPKQSTKDAGKDASAVKGGVGTDTRKYRP
ncbi:MAG TPA: hypothetical protein VJM11_05565 [Nevskiaceae bacterium]|nr:hypothetical protein [Nevskiaceae bacterium]